MNIPSSQNYTSPFCSISRSIPELNKECYNNTNLLVLIFAETGQTHENMYPQNVLKSPSAIR